MTATSLEIANLINIRQEKDKEEFKLDSDWSSKANSEVAFVIANTIAELQKMADELSVNNLISAIECGGEYYGVKAWENAGDIGALDYDAKMLDLDVYYGTYDLSPRSDFTLATIRSSLHVVIPIVHNPLYLKVRLLSKLGYKVRGNYRSVLVTLPDYGLDTASIRH